MKQKRRNVCGRITAVLTVLAMILSLDFFSVNSGFLFDSSAEKVKAADMVEYLEGSWNISKNTLIYSTRAVSEYTLVDSTVKDWNTGFYVVKNDVAINDRVVVNGDVKLILCDGATLNTKKGITVPTNNSLTIYAQSEGTGTLKAVLDSDSKLIAAGIGGYYRAYGEVKNLSEKIDCGNITIHGGNIDAKGYSCDGGYDCSGIGTVLSVVVPETACQKITICGGTVHATGFNDSSSGIGGPEATFFMYGGKVTTDLDVTCTTGSGISAKAYIYGGEVYGEGAGGMAGIASLPLTLGSSATLSGSDTGKDSLSPVLKGGSINDPTMLYVYMQVIANHSHRFSFTANGESITASCIEKNNGTCNLTDDIVFTLTAPALKKEGTSDSPAAKVAVNKSLVDTGIKMPAVVYMNGTEVLSAPPEKAGTYKALITLGGVTASVEYTIDVAKVYKNLSDDMISAIPEMTFTGEALRPSVKVTDQGTALVEGTDYILSYKDNVNAGTATVTLTGIGDYIGTASTSFKINEQPVPPSPKALDKNMITVASEFYYTGSSIRPEVTVKDGESILSLGKDYVISYKDNLNIGTAIVTVTGKGDYAGSVEVEFSIIEAPVEPTPDPSTSPSPSPSPSPDPLYVNNTIDNTKDLISADMVSVTGKRYTGNPVKATVTVRDGGINLVENTDYTLSFENNVDAGYASVTVTGIGKYAGNVTLPFLIERKNLKKDFIAEIEDQEYSGEEIKPVLSVIDGDAKLTEGKDFVAVYSDNVAVGTATITVTGIGNYKNEVSLNFSILSRPKPLEEKMFTVEDALYTGKEVTPKVSGKDEGIDLKEGTDFTVEYKDNVEAGNAKAIITGKGKYYGSVEIQFKIQINKQIEECTVAIKPNEYTYTGKKLNPEITINDGEKQLVQGTDYQIDKGEYINVREYTVNIIGKGIYTGETSVKFTISPKPVTNDMFIIEDVQYTGKAIEPEIVATDGSLDMSKDNDFTVAYKNNTEVGTATATITGKGNYTGSVDVKFQVLGKSIAKATVTGISTAAYTGKAIKPKVTVKLDGKTLKNGTDYTVTYKNNTKVGTATVTITGKGDYSGKITKKFQIKQISFKYRAYVQKKNWMSWSTAKVSGTSASMMAGTTDNLRMETIQMQLSGVSGQVKYRAYVEKMGWTQWATTADTTTYAGTKGMSRRIEMIQLQASGQVATLYDMYYRTYCEKFGWLGWVKSGEKSGSAGYARKLEAFQVNFVRKGETFSVKSDTTKGFYDSAKDGKNPK